MSKNGAPFTLISEKSEVIGELKVENDLRVEGYVKGTVTVKGSLDVQPGGRIEGDIVTQQAQVGGQILGNIQAQGRLVLRSSSQLQGDIRTANLIIEEGAKFIGRCNMGEEPATNKPKLR